MPLAWLLAPYRVRLDPEYRRPVRYCALVGMDAALDWWREAEISGQRALVLASGAPAALAAVAAQPGITRLGDEGLVTARPTQALIDALGDDADRLPPHALGYHALRQLLSRRYAPRLDRAAGRIVEDPAEPLPPQTHILHLAGASPAAFAPPVIDNFNRANGPLIDGVSWAQNEEPGGIITANQLGADGTNYVDCYYAAAQFGPDVDVAISMPTKMPDTRYLALIARLRDPGAGTWDGYQVTMLPVSGTDTVEIRRTDNGIDTVLGAVVSQEWAAGDSLGLRCFGSSIELWRKPSGGDWTQLATRTDSTYGAAGYVGLVAHRNTTWRCDDFAAVTVAEESALRRIVYARGATAAVVRAGRW